MVSAPEYLVNRLQEYFPTRALRYVGQNLPSVQNNRIKIVDSSFTIAVSILWNELPSQTKKARTIDCFIVMVKTNLFEVYTFSLSMIVLYIVYISLLISFVYL